jgi:hypothetical protein
MKNTLLVIVALLVGGCDTSPTMKSVAGTYELKDYRAVLLENGIWEDYLNDKKGDREAKWKITKEGELHVTYSDVGIVACRINKDGSITEITRTSIEGERVVIPKNYQTTYKKIK